MALGEGLDHPAIGRSMPNTPAQIGQGVTVWYATDSVDAQGKAQTRAMLSALGREFEVHDERQVAMATAVSGTGPTYIFLFIEALTDAAVHLGFPRHVARELVLDTMQGSAAFALASGKHVAELRDMVTSPGGTSAEALYQLERVLILLLLQYRGDGVYYICTRLGTDRNCRRQGQQGKGT